MSQNRWRLGLRPRPQFGELTALPQTPIAVLRGLTSKGWQGKQVRRKGRGKGGKGRGGEGKKGVGTVGLKPSQSNISGYVTAPIYAILHGAVSCKGYFALALVQITRVLVHVDSGHVPCYMCKVP